MEKRYQVFVSSTYTDLIEERSEVMQALLELNCMPSGMELFPAANDTQWNWIKKVIDESDYYIVIIGGRYGTISATTGLSYTEMEYRYAVETGKPIISFLHEDMSKIPSGLCEQSNEGKEKLEVFRKYVQTRLCKYWSNPMDLGAKVSRSITQLIKQYPATGWIKADLISYENNSDEILKLKRKIESLEAELEKVRTEKPIGTENLASGTDLFTISYTFKRKRSRENEGRVSWYNITGDSIGRIDFTWDGIFAIIAPKMLNSINSQGISNILNDLIESNAYKHLEEVYPYERFFEFNITNDSLKTILIQLRALKLIASSKENEWILTPYGDTYMNQLLAVHKNK